MGETVPLGRPWCPVVGQQVFAQPLPTKGHTPMITDLTACFPSQYVLFVKLVQFLLKPGLSLFPAALGEEFWNASTVESAGHY